MTSTSFHCRASAFFGGVMLFSLGIIFILGMMMGRIAEILKLPRLLGLLICGMIIGPYGLNLLEPSILLISADLRKLALLFILLRAGLSLNIEDLKKAGSGGVLMCFLPALFEIAAMAIFAPILLGIEVKEALLLGSVIAAVSPAVIVPKMLTLMEEGYGKKKAIPQMILAGASVDDVFVLVLFTAFSTLVKGNGFAFSALMNIPLSIASGIIIGCLLGYGFVVLFRKTHLRNSHKLLLLLGVAFLSVSMEERIQFPYSGMLSLISLGMIILHYKKDTAQRLALKFSKLWIGAELLLFVLVGASVDLRFVWQIGMSSIILLCIVLLFRMLGVYCCMWKTSLNCNEKLFCMVAYLPKATVQAAIGGIPLALGLNCGSLILSVAVLSILFTAPLGAMLIDLTYQKWLQKD